MVVGRHGRGHPGQLLGGTLGGAVAQDAVDARHAWGGAVHASFCVDTVNIIHNLFRGLPCVFTRLTVSDEPLSDLPSEDCRILHLVGLNLGNHFWSGHLRLGPADAPWLPPRHGGSLWKRRKRRRRRRCQYVLWLQLCSLRLLLELVADVSCGQPGRRHVLLVQLQQLPQLQLLLLPILVTIGSHV